MADKLAEPSKHYNHIGYLDFLSPMWR
jgi:hypothetical protein